MSFRYLWIVSLHLRSVLYLRRFPNVERRAKKMSLQEVDIRADEQLIQSLLTSLSINTTGSEPELECFVGNQLPVIEMTYKSVKLWPIVVVEQNGLLFCCYPLCETKSKDLIDEKAIALGFTALQTISRCFSREKGLSWIEWFLTSTAPFGTFVNHNYESINKLKTKTKRIEKSLQNDSLKLMINELISRNKDKELIFGTISTDELNCCPNSIQNCLLSLKPRNMDSLNLVLPPNCCTNGSNAIQMRPTLDSNPLNTIHYKCNSDALPMKTFLTYSYNMTRITDQKNLYRINLTLNVKNSTQFKFNYFNVQFKPMSDNSSWNPIKSSLTFGQLRHENVGLFWVIGNKFPKCGQIKLNFEIYCLNNKYLEIETICNFQIENFQSSQSFADSVHFAVDDLSFLTNTKIPIIIDSTLTSVDYKLFPDIN